MSLIKATGTAELHQNKTAVTAAVANRDTAVLHLNRTVVVVATQSNCDTGELHQNKRQQQLYLSKGKYVTV